MGSRFQPGDIVILINGLEAFESITGTPSNGNAGGIVHGRRTGIVISACIDGYDVDFGGKYGSCISISEQYLARA